MFELYNVRLRGFGHCGMVEEDMGPVTVKDRCESSSVTIGLYRAAIHLLCRYGRFSTHASMTLSTRSDTAVRHNRPASRRPELPERTSQPDKLVDRNICDVRVRLATEACVNNLKVLPHLLPEQVLVWVARPMRNVCLAPGRCQQVTQRFRERGKALGLIYNIRTQDSGSRMISMNKLITPWRMIVDRCFANQVCCGVLTSYFSSFFDILPVNLLA